MKPSSNNILYVSSTILDRLVKLAALRFNCNYDDVAFIDTRSREVPYKKQGVEFIKDEISFHLFNADLQKIGIIKREEYIKRYVKNSAGTDSEPKQKQR